MTNLIKFTMNFNGDEAAEYRAQKLKKRHLGLLRNFEIQLGNNICTDALE